MTKREIIKMVLDGKKPPYVTRSRAIAPKICRLLLKKCIPSTNLVLPNAPGDLTSRHAKNSESLSGN